MGGSGVRVESREQNEMAEKGVLIPVESSAPDLHGWKTPAC